MDLNQKIPMNCRKLLVKSGQFIGQEFTAVLCLKFGIIEIGHGEDSAIITYLKRRDKDNLPTDYLNDNPAVLYGLIDGNWCYIHETEV